MGDDDELNITPPTPFLGKRPQRQNPKGPDWPWERSSMEIGKFLTPHVTPPALEFLSRRSGGSNKTNAVCGSVALI